MTEPEAVRLLRKSEWAAFDFDKQDNFCWCCGAHYSFNPWRPEQDEPKHKDGCELDAFLKSLDKHAEYNDAMTICGWWEADGSERYSYS